MKNSLVKMTSAVLAASFLAVSVNALAGANDPRQQPPVDCKEKPEDPSCKGKGK